MVVLQGIFFDFSKFLVQFSEGIASVAGDAVVVCGMAELFEQSPRGFVLLFQDMHQSLAVFLRLTVGDNWPNSLYTS